MGYLDKISSMGYLDKISGMGYLDIINITVIGVRYLEDKISVICRGIS